MTMRAGNLLIVIGAVTLLAGGLIRLFPGAFAWFGNLPGDVRIESENGRVFIPITSMLLVSVLLTIVANLVASMLRNR